MNLNQKQFSEFVAKKVKESDMNQNQVAQKTNRGKSAISNALRKLNNENSRYNGTRNDILKLLGYETEKFIKVKKIID